MNESDLHQNSIVLLQHIITTTQAVPSPSFSSISECESGWISVTYPPKTGNNSEFTSSRKSLPGVTNLWLYQHSLCEWVSVWGPEPERCRKCHYTTFDCVSALPTGSCESAYVLYTLCCVPCMCCVGSVTICKGRASDNLLISLYCSGYEMCL